MITIGNLFDKIIRVQEKTIQKVNYVALSSTIITYKGNTFNGPSQLVQLDKDGKLPALDGSNLTNLPLDSYLTTNETSGLISSALLAYIKAADVYTKTEIDGITKNLSDTIDKLQAGEVQLTNYYTKADISAISGELDDKFDNYTTSTELSELLAHKADLISGKIPAAQLPSYVDDVIQCYFKDSHIYSDKDKINELTIQPGKIYIDLETNRQYRWGGTLFVEISQSLALGETADTAFAGNRGKTLQTEVASLKNAGFITNATQTDPIFTANSGKFALTSQITELSQQIDNISNSITDVNGRIDMSNEDINNIISSLDNLSTQVDILSSTEIVFPVSSVNGKTGNVVLKISDFENDKKYLTKSDQSDPIFTANSGKFALTGQITSLSNQLDNVTDVLTNLSTTVDMSAEDINNLILNIGNITQQLDAISGKPIEFPVSSVNGKTGNVVLKISDFENDKEYLTKSDQSDPIFAANSGQFALTGQVKQLQQQLADISNSITDINGQIDMSNEDINSIISSLDNLSTQVDTLSGAEIVFPVSSVNGKTGNVVLKISDFENDKKYLTKSDQSDPIFTANSGKFALIENVYDKHQIDDILLNKADLVSGKIPASQLPSYVDDVIQGTINLTNNTMTDLNGKSVVIESSKIYIDKTTNKTYRWSGSSFVEISSSLALGETSSTAFAGDRGKILQTEVASLKNAGFITNATQTDPIFTANSGKFALTSELADLSERIDEIQAGDVQLTNYYTKSEIDNKNYITNSYAESNYASKSVLENTNNNLIQLSTQVINVLSGGYLNGLNVRLNDMLSSLE